MNKNSASYYLVIIVMLMSFWEISYGQKNTSNKANHIYTINWKTSIDESIGIDDHIRLPYFENAVYTSETFIPIYIIKKYLPSFSTQLKVSIVPESSHNKSINSSDFQSIKHDLSKEFNVSVSYAGSLGKPIAIIQITPLSIQGNDQVELLDKFSLKIDLEKNGDYQTKRSAVESSLFQNGTWFKFGYKESGIYRLGYQDIVNIGLNPDQLNVSTLGVFATNDPQLPYNNSESRLNQPVELPVLAVGLEDSKFDQNDYLLFYCASPIKWTWNFAEQIYSHDKHDFSDSAFVFFSPDKGTLKILSQSVSPATFTNQINSTFDRAFYEKDQVNLIKSGREWYGEHFSIATLYNFSFPFLNVKPENAVVKAYITARTTGSGQSNFQITSPGNTGFLNLSTDNVSGQYYHEYALNKSGTFSFIPGNSTVPIQINYYKGNSSAEGWLNYLEITVKRELKLSGRDLVLRYPTTSGNLKAVIAGLDNSSKIWDISNPVNPEEILFSLTQGSGEITFNNDNIAEILVFNSALSRSLTFSKRIVNQNVHGSRSPQYIVITPDAFLPYASDLASFHSEKDGFETLVVTCNQVYNEFSGGKPDASAYRELVKYFYGNATNENDKPKFLLLFGDGSYDNMNRIGGNPGKILTYQSANSTHPTASFVSDDYFGFLDGNEGESVNDIVDIGIGRLPVNTSQEAIKAVNKIKSYYNSSAHGRWRNWMTFVGDDEDNNTHMSQADDVSNMIESRNQSFNIDKIYFDAYLQESSPGGERYPGVNEAIDSRMEQGSLFFNYVGHGGELGWGHERVLEISQINNWDNAKKLPVFVTATCEFSRFDDPQRTSAGEYVFLNPNGGGVGLFTTTRLVYSSPNKTLIDTFFFHVSNPDIEKPTYLGDLMKETKSRVIGTNSKNFTLLGDPGLKLPLPEFPVVTTEITDTMKALQKITVKGEVRNSANQMNSNYNGTVYPVVFDKKSNIQSLDNDGNGMFPFSVRKNILFNGKASVTDGTFEFSFVVPKDINYNFSNGRISYYSTDSQSDGNGFDDSFVIGGFDENAPADLTGPDIEMYMNNDQFINGGITDPSPTLLIHLNDEHGINTVGNGIGHDLTAILDGDKNNPVVLNGFYEAELNSYQKGEVNYPLKNLSAGKHHISVKVWDVYNNSSESELEFVVAEDENIVIEHLLNYPNPFSTSTDFYFEHNMPGQLLEVKIDIFTVSGKRVSSIFNYYSSDGFRAGPFHWNGKDEFGDILANGVYVYRLKVTSPLGESNETIEKLVILN